MKRIIFLLITILIISSAISVFATENLAPEVQQAALHGYVPPELLGDYNIPITRLEFAHLAVSFFSVVTETPVSELPTEYVFSDTDNGYVAAASGLGIINGRSETVFAPDDGITRQEAAVMMTNTLAVCGEIFANEKAAKYADLDTVAAWAAPAVGIMQSKKIMTGTDDRHFSPLDDYTREQAIISFERMYRLIVGKNANKLSLLSVSNGRLISNDGSEVILNGINLGGWLLLESWMSPINDPEEKLAYSDIISILNERFGAQRTVELIFEYEKNFITSADFARIANLGFNCVRLPFWYRNFMTAEGEWLSDNHNTNPGFKTLDNVVKLCEKYGLYLILDMHGCPGGQSTNHTTGQIGKNDLYDSEENIAAMEKLWEAIAHRYKNKACIAAYDIMNEPQNNDSTFGEKAYAPGSTEATERTNAVYLRMISAIRKNDPNHIITVEGIWSLSSLLTPDEYSDDNLMYQLHIYDSTKQMLDRRTAELTEYRFRFGVAPLVGEYNSKELEAYAADLYNEKSINRIKWTYKTVGVEYDNWGLYNKSTEKLDIKSASYSEIKKAFGKQLRTENGFDFNNSEYEIIQR